MSGQGAVACSAHSSAQAPADHGAKRAGGHDERRAEQEFVDRHAADPNGRTGTNRRPGAKRAGDRFRQRRPFRSRRRRDTPGRRQYSFGRERKMQGEEDIYLIGPNRRPLVRKKTACTGPEPEIFPREIPPPDAAHSSRCRFAARDGRLETARLFRAANKPNP